MVKNLPANAGNTRDISLIPGLERSLRIGNANPHQSSFSLFIFNWRIIALQYYTNMMYMP